MVRNFIIAVLFSVLGCAIYAQTVYKMPEPLYEHTVWETPLSSLYKGTGKATFKAKGADIYENGIPIVSITPFSKDSLLLIGIREDRNQLSIYPTGESDRVLLTILEDGNPIAYHEFEVRKVPMPSFIFDFSGYADEDKIWSYTNQRHSDGSLGTVNAPKILTMRPLIDEHYKRMYPKDARFRVYQSTVSLKRGTSIIGSLSVEGPKYDISTIMAQAQAGDVLTVEITKIGRMNFSDKISYYDVAETVKISIVE